MIFIFMDAATRARRLSVSLLAYLYCHGSVEGSHLGFYRWFRFFLLPGEISPIIFLLRNSALDIVGLLSLSGVAKCCFIPRYTYYTIILYSGG
ncbi:hypothetical protein QBC43DRAFT_39028 [Cladorrhinum sp. PSN259]|nr:hypothetical protein QBC43DRAFT_39028 [Cladorrhinum sp. PSN259]